MTGHLLVFPNATRSRAATDGAGTAVHHGAVGHLKTTESVAFHGALEAAAFAVGNDVDPLTGAEELEARMRFGSGGAFFEAELLDEALWRRAGFLEAAQVRLGNALFLLIVETDFANSYNTQSIFGTLQDVQPFTWHRCF